MMIFKAAQSNQPEVSLGYLMPLRGANTAHLEAELDVPPNLPPGKGHRLLENEATIRTRPGNTSTSYQYLP